MAEKKKECPLCGKPIDGDDVLCNDCRHSADNQYELDLLEQSDSGIANQSQIDTGSNSLNANKKKRPRAIIYFVLLCFIVTILGVIGSLNLIQLREDKVAEDNYWKSCVESNTQLSYSKYLVAYPKGKYVDEANEQIEKLKNEIYTNWMTLKSSTDMNDFFTYIKNNPNSLYIDSAKYLVDSISWSNAKSLGTLEAIKTYLSSIEVGVIDGLFKTKALDRYDYLATIRPLDSLQIDSIRFFLNNLYLNLDKKDTTFLNKVFLSKIKINNDSILKEDFIQNLLNRQINKDSIIKFAPNLSSIVGSIDRDNIISLNFIETKTVESKPLKRRTKTNKKIEPKFSYSDTLAITLMNKNTIIRIAIHK